MRDIRVWKAWQNAHVEFVLLLLRCVFTMNTETISFCFYLFAQLYHTRYRHRCTILLARITKKIHFPMHKKKLFLHSYRSSIHRQGILGCNIEMLLKSRSSEILHLKSSMNSSVHNHKLLYQKNWEIRRVKKTFEMPISSNRPPEPLPPPVYPAKKANLKKGDTKKTTPAAWHKFQEPKHNPLLVTYKMDCITN